MSPVLRYALAVVGVGLGIITVPIIASLSLQWFKNEERKVGMFDDQQVHMTVTFIDRDVAEIETQRCKANINTRKKTFYIYCSEAK